MNDKSLTDPWAGDRLGRKGIAKFLTRHLDDEPSIRVLNINASWGAGKTFFLNNWKSEQASERVCIYFNAWEADFSGDAFVALASVIREQLKDIIGPAASAEDMIAKFTKKAARTLIAATPALAKGVVKKFTGIDIAAVSEVIDSDAVADAAEKAVEKLIESNKEALDTVKDFKKNFHELIQLAGHTMAAGDSIKPAYIFIDELDRCRPTFAIELLERVKHLFDVPDCKFIIATDTAQLGHSIRAVYGAGFGSDKYLKRFFDREFSLSPGDFDLWIKHNVTFDGKCQVTTLGCSLFPGGGVNFMGDQAPNPDVDTVLAGRAELSEEQVIILALAKTFNVKLRELEKIVAQIHSIHSNVSGGSLDFFWASYLVFLKDEASDLFEIAIRGDTRGIGDLLNKRYPPKKFMFSSALVDVHQIFIFYLSRFRAGKLGAKNMSRPDAMGELEYMMRAGMGFFNHFDALAMYPSLVELAHSIE